MHPMKVAPDVRRVDGCFTCCRRCVKSLHPRLPTLAHASQFATVRDVSRIRLRAERGSTLRLFPRDTPHPMSDRCWVVKVWINNINWTMNLETNWTSSVCSLVNYLPSLCAHFYSLAYADVEQKRRCTNQVFQLACLINCITWLRTVALQR